MLKISRRRFVTLGTLLAGSTLAGIAARCWPAQGAPHPLSEPEQALVTRYVDLLIPADETPGALDLEVHLQVMAHSSSNPRLRKVIRKGGEWLDHEARRLAANDFVSLTPQDQIHLIERSERSRVSTVQRRLFSQLRQISFQYYYSNGRTWGQLGFRGPPQPLGHPDYRLPPEMGRS